MSSIYFITKYPHSTLPTCLGAYTHVFLSGLKTIQINVDIHNDLQIHTLTIVQSTLILALDCFEAREWKIRQPL